MVNIHGLDKSEVLKTLFNCAKQQGLGLMNQTGKQPMQIDTAKALLKDGKTYFDYILGRVLKIDLSSNIEFDERLYDRDNGTGAAAKAIEGLRIQSATELDKQ